MMIEIYFDKVEKRYTFHWFDEEIEGNDGPITEQLYALLLGLA